MNTQDELTSRIERLRAEADQISTTIRRAERLLQGIPATQDVSWAYLSWNHKDKRIVSTTTLYDGRPLIECPLRERVCRQSEIDGLIDAVLMSSESFMEKHRAQP